MRGSKVPEAPSLGKYGIEDWQTDLLMGKTMLRNTFAVSEHMRRFSQRFKEILAKKRKKATISLRKLKKLYKKINVMIVHYLAQHCFY